jgi:hypothetical protein
MKEYQWFIFAIFLFFDPKTVFATEALSTSHIRTAGDVAFIYWDSGHEDDANEKYAFVIPPSLSVRPYLFLNLFDHLMVEFSGSLPISKFPSKYPNGGFMSAGTKVWINLADKFVYLSGDFLYEALRGTAVYSLGVFDVNFQRYRGTLGLEFTPFYWFYATPFAIRWKQYETPSSYATYANISGSPKNWSIETVLLPETTATDVDLFIEVGGRGHKGWFAWDIAFQGLVGVTFMDEATNRLILNSGGFSFGINTKTAIGWQIFEVSPWRTCFWLGFDLSYHIFEAGPGSLEYNDKGEIGKVKGGPQVTWTDAMYTPYARLELYF